MDRDPGVKNEAWIAVCNTAMALLCRLNSMREAHFKESKRRIRDSIPQESLHVATDDMNTPPPPPSSAPPSSVSSPAISPVRAEWLRSIKRSSSIQQQHRRNVRYRRGLSFYLKLKDEDKK